MSVLKAQPQQRISNIYIYLYVSDQVRAQMRLVNIQCDDAPGRAMHFTGEEEEESLDPALS